MPQKTQNFSIIINSTKLIFNENYNLNSWISFVIINFILTIFSFSQKENFPKPVHLYFGGFPFFSKQKIVKNYDILCRKTKKTGIIKLFKGKVSNFQLF